ncbi:hypothetical protein FHS85_002929 [Rhodoligotrophos appendicifer]|uniref:hypothetical protein n=1 Tax=Rhodoligotrophos appendicifer TaxID=987056 RepID=UPI001186AFCB|nr:hypothetical protein [Rhodoligotrophos appendicifer]
MASVWITEFQGGGFEPGGRFLSTVDRTRPVTTQKKTIAGATKSDAFAATTIFVTLTCDVAFHARFGDTDVAATTDDEPYAAGEKCEGVVTPGAFVSVIAAV